MTNNRWVGLPPLQAQSEIITEMSRSMINSIIGDWDYATYTIALFGGQGSGRFSVVDSDGNARLGRDRATFNLADHLKRVMFVDGRGSWFTMTLTVRNGGVVDVAFDYEGKPDLESRVLGVTAYSTSREQLQFHRDREHQPDWYAALLDEFIEAEQARLDVWAARDKLWAGVGQSGEVSNSHRLVTLHSGISIIASDGYSNPSPNHPGDPGFELFMPSTLFAGDLDKARSAWPFKGLNYLIMLTTKRDLDWPSLVVDGLRRQTYVPNIVNDTPDDWRSADTDGDDLCGLLVGVRFPGVPDTLDGPDGPIKLIGVIPARPAEWQYLDSLDGSAEAAARVATGLAQLDPVVLASPDRPSVI